MAIFVFDNFDLPVEAATHKNENRKIAYFSRLPHKMEGHGDTGDNIPPVLVYSSLTEAASDGHRTFLLTCAVK